MQVATFQYIQNNWINKGYAIKKTPHAQLLLIFGAKPLIAQEDLYLTLKKEFPKANLVTCSTAGEILDTSSLEDSLVGIAIDFEKTELQFAISNINNHKGSYEMGKALGESLPSQDLRYILLISDGNMVNGDALLKGITEFVPKDVLISGGMAGDGAAFKDTLVGLNGDIQNGNVVLIGFYGNHIKIGTGSKGGWDVFGPGRQITASKGNVLFEINHTNALELYKKYLGKYAEELPGSALQFPLEIWFEDDNYRVVRTILSINEKEQSMTFAGDIPVGAKARFMKTNFDNLILASQEATLRAVEQMEGKEPELALIISCVGRKIVLGNRIDEEIETAADYLASKTKIAGFFSYGEICPTNDSYSKACYLHNQTYTITTFTELV